MSRIGHPGEYLDAPVDIAVHEVGAAQPHSRHRHVLVGAAAAAAAAADAAAADADAKSKARVTHYEKMADKLIALLKATPVKRKP